MGSAGRGRQILSFQMPLKWQMGHVIVTWQSLQAPRHVELIACCEERGRGQSCGKPRVLAAGGRSGARGPCHISVVTRNRREAILK